VQQALTALGFDTKGSDGKPGPTTRKAIAAWQAGKQQEVTGYLTGQQRDLVLSEARPKLEAERQEALLTVQRLLIKLGHNLGRPDGKLEAATVQALQDEGLRLADSRPDPAELKRLASQLERKHLRQKELWVRTAGLLQGLGYKGAAPDGTPDESMRAALSDFARKIGRPAVTAPDEAMVAALEREQEAAKKKEPPSGPRCQSIRDRWQIGEPLSDEDRALLWSCNS
jgi:peptidoglycan hydrolase-like protein with peptidoglycan-binding domain